MKGHGGLVRSLFLDYSNKRVLSGSYDQGIRVYDFESGDQIAVYDNWTTSWILAAKSDYRRIIATSQDGRALLMDFGIEVDKKGILSGVPMPVKEMKKKAHSCSSLKLKIPPREEVPPKRIGRVPVPGAQSYSNVLTRPPSSGSLRANSATMVSGWGTSPSPMLLQDWGLESQDFGVGGGGESPFP